MPPPCTDARATSSGCWAIAGSALELIERAVDIHRSAPPTVEYVRALKEQEEELQGLGRSDEAGAVTGVALQICSGLAAPRLYRSLLVQDAYRLFDSGDPAGALARLDEAAHLELDGPDPEGDITVAVARTDILHETGRVGDEVAEAGRPGLEVATAWGLETRNALIVRSNMASALRHSGQVRRAAEIIDPVTGRTDPCTVRPRSTRSAAASTSCEAVAPRPSLAWTQWASCRCRGS